MEHAGWTVEDWKWVGFSDESKFLLFKSAGRQYAWFHPGQALDERYVKKNIKHGARNLMVGAAGLIFQQDNDPKHTSIVAKEWFRKKNIKQLPWPPSSPDMNIIEHVWDQLDALVHARKPLLMNKEQLWQAIQEEWANFPCKALDTLYESMPHCVAALLKARSCHTKY
ncbi:Transposable element Tcb2 transposase [Hypsizygus marmoreus]|uniref:Transposable element Tcb2 transposase n=1 Tax=Hypsizygus marmoreus TaxID=39966 RepID=A0A369J255_HYPMA|nr:Transposable element Tcb2 transposase [Hypsizygus marmoreus]